MKTTLDLPDALVKQIKLRALHEGQKLNDTVAELLRKGLAIADDSCNTEEAVITTDSQTGLPVIAGGHPALPGQELTPDRIAEILLAQEVEWFNAARRH
jgi:hypothetical protein